MLPSFCTEGFTVSIPLREQRRLAGRVPFHKRFSPSGSQGSLEAIASCILSLCYPSCLSALDTSFSDAFPALAELCGPAILS